MEVKIPFTKMTAEEMFVVPTGGNDPRSAFRNLWKSAERDNLCQYHLRRKPWNSKMNSPTIS